MSKRTGATSDGNTKQYSSTLKSPSSAAMLEGFTFPSAPETSQFQTKQADFSPYLKVSPLNTEAAGEDYE